MGGRLTNKQRAFAEAWLAGKNRTQAAIAAGYSERTAAQIGYENLKKPQILAYIHERTQGLAHVADADEALRFLTRVLRGEEKDQFGLEISAADRMHAGELLLKRFAVLEERAGSEREGVRIEFGEDVEEAGV